MKGRTPLVESPSLVRRGFYAIIQQFRDSFGLFFFNIQSQKYLTQKILDQFVSNLQVRCICTRRTIAYNMIAKDQAQRMLLRATQQLAEAKLLGKSRCQPRTATARWTGVRLVMVVGTQADLVGRMRCRFSMNPMLHRTIMRKSITSTYIHLRGNKSKLGLEEAWVIKLVKL